MLSKASHNSRKNLIWTWALVYGITRLEILVIIPMAKCNITLQPKSEQNTPQIPETPSLRQKFAYQLEEKGSQ